MQSVSLLALEHRTSSATTTIAGVTSKSVITMSDLPVSEAPQFSRQSSLDEETTRRLEKQISQRPEKKSELVDRNILKEQDDRVAPALQAARDQLEKAQKQDWMGHALLHRPKPEELVKEGILQRTLSAIQVPP
ncbi:hypothetical protein M0805_006371 [Coniferiporia weirii]|nr:hypothetical protein M0805_006371 [Coniferiporia weirii]